MERRMRSRDGTVEEEEEQRCAVGAGGAGREARSVRAEQEAAAEWWMKS